MGAGRGHLHRFPITLNSNHDQFAAPIVLSATGAPAAARCQTLKIDDKQMLAV